ncbi:MAG: hypothetical protein JW699_02405 [Chitinispirillaceae bacterium]|nr:hypothetical protein [Chitinispirillaceae bacterium]
MTAPRTLCCSAAAALLAAALLCPAQSLLSTHYPGGLPIAHAAGPSLSMGGAGTGVRNDFFGMADNVANLGGMNRAVFSASTSFDFTSINEGNASSSLFALTPRLFSFAFHIAPVGTFGFSLDQRTSTRMKFVATSVTALYDGRNITDSCGLAVRGGLKSWQAGWGRALGTWGFAGIACEWLYLSSDNISLYSTDLGTTEPRYDSTRLLFRGNAVRGGVLVPVRKWSFGMSGEYVFEGDAERTVTSTDSTTGERQEFPLSLPPSLSFGASYAPSPSWTASASTGITLWQSYRSAVALGGKVDNALSFAAGVQYIPAPNLLVPRYWEIMQYRLGFRFCELPVVTGTEFAFTAGVGLPLLKGGGLIDVIAEYGSRSDSRYGNYAERFLHLYLGINGGRKWSQKTGIRY